MPIEPDRLPEPVRPTRPRWVVPVVIAAAVLLLLAGAGAAAWVLRPNAATTPSAPATSAAPPAQVLVSGRLFLRVINPDEWDTLEEPCAGEGGYSDIDLGAQVIVTDPAGKTVAVGELSLGQVSGENFECRFYFSVYAPAGLGFYGIAIGNRKPHQVAEKDLAPFVDLTLGYDG